jgi:hypothetical protein
VLVAREHSEVEGEIAMSSLAVPAPEAAPKSYSRWIPWLGWAVSMWPVFVVVSSANWKLSRNPWYVGEFARIGWPDSSLPLLATLQLCALALFLIPRTAVLGAILLTGYMGGAVATYFRIQEYYPPLVPFSTAAIAWIGLWLRDARLRSLTPIRK